MTLKPHERALIDANVSARTAHSYSRCYEDAAAKLALQTGGVDLKNTAEARVQIPAARRKA